MKYVVLSLVFSFLPVAVSADPVPTPRPIYSVTYGSPYGDVTPALVESVHCNPGMPKQYGTVYSVSQWKIQLTDARSILLSKYTVIDPVGGVIRKGQHLLVEGYYSPASKSGAPVIDGRYVSILNGDGQSH